MTPRTFLLLLQMPIVAFLAISSLQAQRAFRQRGFFFVSLGWMLNLAYLLANHYGSLVPEGHGWIMQHLVRAADLLDVLTAAAFWHAYTYARPTPTPRPRLIAAVLFFFALITYHFLVFFQVAPQPGPRGSIPQVIASVIGIASLTAFYRLLTTTGRRRDRALLAAGLLTYLVIQPLYLIAFLWPLAMEWGFVLGMIAKIFIAFGVVGYLVAAAAQGAHAEEQEIRIRELTATLGRVLHDIGTPVFQIGVHSSRLVEVAPRGAFHSHLQSLENARLTLTATLEAARQLLPKSDSLINLHQHTTTFQGIPRFNEQQVISANTLVALALMAVKETRSERVRVTTQYSAQCCVRCVPIDITRALINLMRNAYDAMPDGVGMLHIETHSEERATGAVITIHIQDDGEGIPPGRTTTVFQMGETTRGGIGRGYGLPVVKEMVERNEGTVELISPAASTSAPRPGVRITLTFPRVPCKEKAA